MALLEADVALPVVKDLVAKVRERAVGQEVIRSVSPAQQVVKIVNDAIGALRLKIGHSEFGKKSGLFEDKWAPLWVVDFPMFEENDDGSLTAMHHPFTAPKCSPAELEANPAAALSRAYDMVLNGTELGGGSIRIHRKEMQQAVFRILGIDEAEQEEKFGFLLEGFKYGAPPHGGIAFGWDRVVALLAGTDSIREVIAFPKTGGGFDPLTAAPAPITAQQRKEAGVDAKPEPKQAEAEPEA